MSRTINLLFSFICMLLIGACSSKSSDQKQDQALGQAQNMPTKELSQSQEPELPQLLIAALNAHGGLSNWKSMRTIDFEIDKNGAPERHIIDLNSRKALIEYGDQYRVGFDGQEVWVSPNKAAFGKGSARFYHNLRFYFIAMPFIISDPGIHYEVQSGIELKGKPYEVLKVTYDNNIGDAPEDEYQLYFDPESKKMEWLLYTVTYYTGKPGDKYNALHYNEWQEVEGLLLPKTMIGYKFSDGKIGEKRYESSVNNLVLSREEPHPSFFDRPTDSEIDSLIQH